MKTFSFLLGLLLFVGNATAQQTMVVKKVHKGDEPKAVMDAIQRDFPNAITKNLSYLPSKLYGEEWNIQLREGDKGDYTYFIVSIKEGNTDYKAVYDADGTLMSSKHIVHHASLPMPVMETLARFTGWHISRTHEIIRYKGNRSTDVYKVKIEKQGQLKIIFLDPQGNIIDTRMAII